MPSFPSKSVTLREAALPNTATILRRPAADEDLAMAIIRGTLYFAPRVKMASLDFENHDALVEAFAKRVRGLFVEPIRFLGKAPGKEGALFAAALLTAALIESIARIEGLNEQEKSIAFWLSARIPEFRIGVDSGSARTAADIFEERFRNGLAHSGFVATFGRLSDEICTPVQIDKGIVTVNPFRLAEAVDGAFNTFLSELNEGRRDKRRFAYALCEQFQQEVNRARDEENDIENAGR
jgi:hypothetical protein